MKNKMIFIFIILLIAVMSMTAITIIYNIKFKYHHSPNERNVRDSMIYYGKQHMRDNDITSGTISTLDYSEIDKFCFSIIYESGRSFILVENEGRKHLKYKIHKDVIFRYDASKDEWIDDIDPRIYDPIK